jgi:hypothetical protein
MPAQEDLAQLRLGPLLLPGTTDGVHPLDRELVFLLSNPPCLLPALGQVGEEDIGEERERYRDDPVDDEQPAPWVVVSMFIQAPPTFWRRRDSQPS